jgi:predicted house-cleaning noncanonical NTP pyrophosphatase (MazG superfamily)
MTKTFTYNKLIRDKNIEIIQNLGHEVTYHVMDDKNYSIELNKKLLEEAYEFIEEHNLEELADLLEVVYSIAELKNIDLCEVERIRQKKKSYKGGFERKIYLVLRLY